MKKCIFSDIHGNLPALEAVIKDSKKYEIDEYICLGDLVGYGPYPDECIKIVKELTDKIVIGNHDAAVIGKMDITEFNKYAVEAVKWTQTRLNTNYFNYIESFNEIIEEDNSYFVHGSLMKPLHEYLINVWIAYTNFKIMEKDFCFVGHTHKPMIFFQDKISKEIFVKKFDGEESIRFEKKYKYIINDGSVGQPRDNDNRACYTIFDSEKNEIALKRVKYDIYTVQQKMKQEGFNDYLIKRLNDGK